MLNIIISTCPAGLPLAQKIREVTPTRDAHNVRKPSPPNAKKETIIAITEVDHKIISVFDRLFKTYAYRQKNN